VLRAPAVRDGQWQLLECAPAWDGNWTWGCFVAFAWQGAGGEHLIVAVNFAPNQGQCYLRLQLADLAGAVWLLDDQFSDACYERDGSDLASRGLYLDVPPWQVHAFSLKRQASV
jgi:hypothetical protein